MNRARSCKRRTMRRRSAVSPPAGEQDRCHPRRVSRPFLPVLFVAGILLAGGPRHAAGDDPVAADGPPAAPVRVVPDQFVEPVLLTPMPAEQSEDGGRIRTSPLSPRVDLRVTAFVAAMLAAVLFLKWGVRRAARPLPREVYAVLGEAPLGGQHSARIVRFGPKTILIAVSGAACTPLSEIDDALVTEQLATACGMRASPPCAVPPTGAQRPVRGDPPATAMEAST